MTPAPPGERPRAGADRATLDTEINLKVTNADVVDLLKTVGEIMSAKLSLDPEVKGTVSLDLENTPLRKALDAICLASGCEWSFDAEKGVLAIRKGPKPRG